MMIVEGIVTTLNPDGTVNVSPMGPRVDTAFKTLILRPFRSSQTYENLKRSGDGVFHITDDVLLLAQSAVGEPNPMPVLKPARQVQGSIIAESCRWYEFQVRSIDDRDERTEIVAEVVEADRNRDFLGFNRAKNAVLEAAILATRIHLLPKDEVLSQFEALNTLVAKTGGPQEHAAFAFLSEYVASAVSEHADHRN